MNRISFALLLAICLSTTQGYAWGWKKTTDPDDVMNFLNSKAPYHQTITEAEITAVNHGGYLEFLVFYCSTNTGKATGGWGWKKATDPNDIKNFLGGIGAYKHPVKEAKVVAVKKKTYTEFYVFYKRALKKPGLHPKIIKKQ
ncbi:MAG: hypothetical protein HUN05_19730 [Desulfobacter sp.]|nr:MAG: hypothetical protein HUN05_19730 [Desulfobacter sp.]